MSHPLYVKKEWKLDAPNREIKDWFLFDTCYVEYSDADLDKVYISIDNLQPIRLSAVASGINLGFPRPTFHLIKITWEPSENGKTLKMVFGREKFVITALSVRILQDLVGLAKEETAQAVRNKLDSNLDVKLSTRASESTLSSIKSKLDSNFDVKLSTRASEDTLSSIDGKITKCDTDNVKVVNTANPPNLDIKLSEHRDALKPMRSTPTQDKSGVSIPANGTENIDKNNLDGYSAIVLTVKATYDANASNGLRVRWLYSPDGTNYDSPEDAEDVGNYEDLTFEKGKTRQRTIVIPILQPYVRIQLVNLDTGYAVTVDAWTTLIR